MKNKVRGCLRPSIVLILSCSLLLATLLIPATAGAAGVCETGGVNSMGRGWTKINPPQWPAPTMPRTDQTNALLIPFYGLAVDPNDADHILFTNGHSVALSTDGGCTWQVVFKLDPSPNYPRINGFTDVISTIFIQGEHIYVHVFHRLVSTLGGGASVFYSHDLGKTFTPSTVGFPPPDTWFTWRKSFAVAPSDPKTLYLAAERNLPLPTVNQGGNSIGVSGNLDSIYASTDGGATWIERSLPTGRASTLTEPMTAQIVIDAKDPNEIWAFAQDKPTYRSEDGGNTWSKVTTITPEGVSGTSQLDIIDGGTFSSILALPSGGAHFLLRSDDGGQSFFKIPTGQSSGGAIFAGTPTKMVMKTHDYSSGFQVMYRLDVRSNRWVDISPPGVESTHDMMVARSASKTVLYSYEPSAVYRYTGRL